MSTSRTISLGSGSGGGSGAMTLLGTATVSGAAATTLTLSSITLVGYKELYVVASLKNATVSAAVPSLYFSGNTTATNYRRQAITSNSTTITASQGNAANVFGLPASQYTEFDATLTRDQLGYPTCKATFRENAGTSLRNRYCLVLLEVSTDITSFQVNSDIASSLDIGSTFSVWGIT